MVDYDRSVSRDEFRRAIQCFADQTCKDFEILIYHDGPKEHPYSKDLEGIEGLPEVRTFVSDERENDWGHSNRDRGIGAAKGEWLIMTNADNVFYPDAVQTLKDAAVSAFKPKIRNRTGNWLQRKVFRTRPDAYVTGDRFDILIFPIILKGCTAVRDGLRRFKGEENTLEVVLSGLPIGAGYIDAMQFVMRRSTWVDEGGWKDKRMDSDGHLYTEFAKKYGIQPISKILGEHW
ncbi:glycosyltransferase family A protein [Shimia isoporae]|nr:glycosyltransferase family A protein [Shimia isoporae]